MAKSEYDPKTEGYTNTKKVTITFEINEDVDEEAFYEAVTNKLYDTLSSELSEETVDQLCHGIINIE